MWFFSATIIGILCSLFWGLLQFKKHDTRPLEYRLLSLLIPPITLVIPIILFTAYLDTPFQFWNGGRLLFSSVLAHGFQVYHPPNSGPILGMAYGPIPAFLWLPATFLPSITTQIVAATAWTSFLYLLPFFWLHMQGHRAPGLRRTLKWTGFLLSCMLLLVFESTRFSATSIHVDPLALSFGLFSCIMLMRLGEQPSSKKLVQAALFVVVAIWCKQNEIFIFFAQLVFLGVAYGRDTLKRYILWFALFGCLSFAAFVFLFGNDGYPMLFHMISIPGGQPMRGGFWRFVWLCFRQLPEVAFFLIAAVWLLGPQRLFSIKKTNTWKQQNSWVLLFIVAAFLFPISIMGIFKVGGDINSFHSTTFLIAAFTTILIQKEICSLNSQQSDENTQPRQPPGGLLFVFLFILFLLPWNQLTELDHAIKKSKDNPQEQAFRIATQLKEKVYIPWYPLPTFYALKRPIHFAYSVHDRFLAKFPVKPKHFYAHIPKNIQYILIHKEQLNFAEAMHTLLQFFPNFRYVPHHKQFPGWILYVKRQRNTKSP